MKEIAPNYYKEFKCIASGCRHSCCIGWEIDIDEDTLAYYRSVSGTLGKRLSACIEENEDGAHFCLDANERCPFLNERGLCDIYTALGEDALCQICTDHPRFRNYFVNRTEIGLGLCCEAAARLILGQSEPFSLITLWDDGEEEETDAFEEWLTAHREVLLDMVWQAKDAAEASENLLAKAGLCFGKPDFWLGQLRSLEQLAPAWTALLSELTQAPEEIWEVFLPEFDRPLRNLLAYFLYRHPAGAEDGCGVKQRIGFACLAMRVVAALCAQKQRVTGRCDFEDLLDFARMYSSEIEYSEDNTERLLSLWEVEE